MKRRVEMEMEICMLHTMQTLLNGKPEICGVIGVNLKVAKVVQIKRIQDWLRMIRDMPTPRGLIIMRR